MFPGPHPLGAAPHDRRRRPRRGRPGRVRRGAPPIATGRSSPRWPARSSRPSPLGRPGEPTEADGSVSAAPTTAPQASRWTPGSVHYFCDARRRGRHPRRLGRSRAVAARGRGVLRRARATTGSPAAAARCSARPGRPCPAAAGATRWCRRRCGRSGVTSREVDVLKPRRRGPDEQGDRRAAVPVAQDRRAPPVQPVRPHRRPEPRGAGGAAARDANWVVRRR